MYSHLDLLGTCRSHCRQAKGSSHVCCLHSSIYTLRFSQKIVKMTDVNAVRQGTHCLAGEPYPKTPAASLNSVL